MRKAKPKATPKRRPESALPQQLDNIHFRLGQALDVLTTVYEEIGAEGWEEHSETPRRLSVLTVVKTMIANEREQLNALRLAQCAGEVSHG